MTAPQPDPYETIAKTIDDKIATALVAGPFDWVIGLLIITAVPLTGYAAANSLGAGPLWSVVVAVWLSIGVAVLVIRQKAHRVKRMAKDMRAKVEEAAE